MFRIKDIALNILKFTNSDVVLHHQAYFLFVNFTTYSSSVIISQYKL